MRGYIQSMYKLESNIIMNHKTMTNKTPLIFNKLIPSWLFLAVSAIAIAGLYSIVLVALRTPVFAEMLPHVNFFRSSLVVHVDLSILVWFFAIQLGLVSLYIRNEHFSKAILALAALGAILIAVSPLYPGIPLLNNYVPILQNFPFALGLAMFICALLISNVYVVLRLLLFKWQHQSLYVLTSAIISLAAMICIYISHTRLQRIGYVNDFGMQDYFERLFWGGGHILQFVYLQLLQFAWIKLYERIAGRLLVLNRFLVIMAWLNVITVLPLLLVNIDISSAEYTLIYTDHMRYFGGIAPTLLAAYLLYKIKPKTYISLEFAAFTCSMLLFFAGGVISLFIAGSNTIIPAHYHGSVVGITVAMNGLIFVLLTDQGFKFIKGKLANLVLYIYSGGQLVHIFGLAISGGYGALRKNHGEVLAAKARIALSFMGVGGLIALIGGLLFVYLCYNAFFCKWCKRVSE